MHGNMISHMLNVRVLNSPLLQVPFQLEMLLPFACDQQLRTPAT
jgi:hypothetical protein